LNRLHIKLLSGHEKGINALLHEEIMNAGGFAQLSQFPQIMQMPYFGAYLCTMFDHFPRISLFLTVSA
jgi:hypothetical protein